MRSATLSFGPESRYPTGHPYSHDERCLSLFHKLANRRKRLSKCIEHLPRRHLRRLEYEDAQPCCYERLDLKRPVPDLIVFRQQNPAGGSLGREAALVDDRVLDLRFLLPKVLGDLLE
jgi:hypothetical protein